jgi:hypothetical protein
VDLADTDGRLEFMACSGVSHAGIRKLTRCRRLDFGFRLRRSERCCNGRPVLDR